MGQVSLVETVPFRDQMCRIGENHWSVPRLAALSRDFEVLEIPLIHLNLADTLGPYTLREMAGQLKTVLAANLGYPIILSADGEVMDGRHRIMHALFYEHETIKAVRFGVDPAPCRVIPAGDA